MSSPRTTAPPGIDVTPVTAWVTDHVPGLEPPLAFERVGEGQSNLTYKVRDAADRVVVLRRPPTGEILPSAHDMGREYRVLTGLALADMPAPRPLALCEDATVTGAPFYVMENVDGLVLSTVAAAERLTPDARAQTGRSLIRTLAQLQSTDLDGTGLGEMRLAVGCRLASPKFLQRAEIKPIPVAVPGRRADRSCQKPFGLGSSPPP